METDYLLDVILREISVGVFHPNAIKAQAIAARSYAYWHIRAGSSINNSTDFQVFIPHSFEALNPTTNPDNPSNPCSSANLNADQQRVCAAVGARHYISYGAPPNDDLPAFSEFFADIPYRTLTGGQPYELSVEDPISSHPAIIQNGHGRGMSQSGASRWAYGNLGFQGNLDPWSLRWENAEQILVHYYTGVQVRDASNYNATITPPYRWNPLNIYGLPSTIYHGQIFPVTIHLQNTGTLDWICQYPNINFELRYRWAKAGHPDVIGADSVSLCGQTKGDPSPLVTLDVKNLPSWGPGVYTLRFDVYLVTATSSYWFSDFGWPAYTTSVCVDGPCKLYLAALFNNSLAR
jgi:hypothetical protein